MSDQYLGKKTVCMDIPFELFAFFSDYCVHHGLTKTRMFTDYLKYLKEEEQQGVAVPLKAKNARNTKK